MSTVDPARPDYKWGNSFGTGRAIEIVELLFPGAEAFSSGGTRLIADIRGRRVSLTAYQCENLLPHVLKGLIDEQLAAKQTEQAKPGWVRIADRQPPEADFYLTYGPPVCLTWYSGSGFYALQGRITHWMELPESQKE